MTVTILPGRGMQAGPGAAPPPDQQPPDQRESDQREPAETRRNVVVVAAAAAVALAALGGGAWFFTRSGSATPAPAVPASAAGHHAPAAVKLPRHGHVPPAELRAVATPAFAAMATSLGGVQATGQVHRTAHDKAGPADSKFNRCAGVRGAGGGQRGVASGKYETGNHVVRGQLDVTASAAAARHDLADMTSPRAVACAKAVVPQMLRHQKLGRYITATGVSLQRLHGVPHAFRMRLVVGYVVNGHETPVQMDFLGATVGRAEVSLMVTSHDTALAPKREAAALRAMTTSVRAALR
jgi:hypothetical protein